MGINHIDLRIAGIGAVMVNHSGLFRSSKERRASYRYRESRFRKSQEQFGYFFPRYLIIISCILVGLIAFYDNYSNTSKIAPPRAVRVPFLCLHHDSVISRCPQSPLHGLGVFLNGISANLHAICSARGCRELHAQRVHDTFCNRLAHGFLATL